MKIALVGPATSIHARQWLRELRGRGHEVALFTVHPHGPGVASSNPVCLPGRTPMSYFTAAHSLRRQLNGFNADIVHAHYATGYGTLARLAGVRPWVQSVWGSDVFDFPEKSRLHRALLTRNLQSADRITSTSFAMRRRVEQLMPSGPTIDVVPFGVDTNAFSPSLGRPRQERRARIGTVKTLASVYGIDELIKAFAVLTGRGVAAELVIAGDGPDRSDLEALAYRLGIGSLTRFLGPIDHDSVPDLLRQLEVFVALSNAESFGVSVVEASACGLPVVVSNAGGLPEIVQDGVTGLVVPRADPVAAANSLEVLINDPLLRSRMGKAGRDAMVCKYSWPQCIARLELVYASTIEAWENR